MPRTPSRALLSVIAVLATLIFSTTAFAAPADDDCPHNCKESISIVPPNLEITRPARTWEFLSATGTQAGIFGNESGRVEAWVYPLKIFRDFHLRFNTGERILNADTLARTITVRPESTTIIYASDTFTVRETFFVPVDQPGAIIAFDVETEFPLEIEAVFHRDFALEWPAGLGATYTNWDRDRHAFYFGEETKTFSAFFGSPTAAETQEEFDTNYNSARENSFRLGRTEKGHDTKLLVLAASVHGRPDAEEIYDRLTTDHEKLLKDSAAYYRDYLARTVSIQIPDSDLQKAYDWSRISVLQGLVTNPYLGTGLVAGYRTSGESQRPGFAWFFGRDSMWTSFALNSVGDFATTKKAIEFISKYQREDGKIPHEIAQGANFVPWFKDYPYPYASADATPLYIIATNDYVTESGDVAFAKSKWDSLEKAYHFLLSTYDSENLPKNFGIGHGWVEGGPLLPVKTELYQSGLGAEALRALSNLAHLTGHDAESKDLAAAFEKQKSLINDVFWLPEQKRYAFALSNPDGKPIDEPTVLATVPMWFGDLDEQKASSMLTQLSTADHQTDWGMRILSNKAEKFSGGGYHYGSVWPLFTGWASVAEYRYHHEHAAYANLRSNALLALDGSPGHVTEVLSGDYYQGLSTSSPHQIWSAAMVVSPILRGLFGLSTDAATSSVVFSPHVPPNWSTFDVNGIPVGNAKLNLSYRRSYDSVESESVELEIENSGTQPATVEFAPALSLRAKVLSAEINGANAPRTISANDQDQHPVLQIKAPVGSTKATIHFTHDFGIYYQTQLPRLGGVSENPNIVSETWNSVHDQLTLVVDGAAGHAYLLSLFDGFQVASAKGSGAELLLPVDGPPYLLINFPQSEKNSRVETTVVVKFRAMRDDKKSR
jgi:glycogen debranching enzyme